METITSYLSSSSENYETSGIKRGCIFIKAWLLLSDKLLLEAAQIEHSNIEALQICTLSDQDFSIVTCTKAENWTSMRFWVPTPVPWEQECPSSINAGIQCVAARDCVPIDTFGSWYIWTQRLGVWIEIQIFSDPAWLRLMSPDWHQLSKLPVVNSRTCVWAESTHLITSGSVAEQGGKLPVLQVTMQTQECVSSSWQSFWVSYSQQLIQTFGLCASL